VKIYIASRYGRKEEMKVVAAKLNAAGHKVASFWIYEIHPTDVTMDQVNDAELRETAMADYIELGAADAMLFFAEDPLVVPPRGGRHVEFGIAIGMGKDIYVIGPKENIFHHFRNVKHFKNLEEFINENI
jgi:hypothetical protein